MRILFTEEKFLELEKFAPRTTKIFDEVVILANSAVEFKDNWNFFR